MSQVYGIILAGGCGSRLWPVGREMYPKQFLKFFNKHTLLQSTFLRLSQVIPSHNIVTVTNTKYLTDTKSQLYDIDKYTKVLTEPLCKNTAPAICLAVYYILKELENIESDPVILVSPSDHVIKFQDEFSESIINGIKLAEAGYIVAFGIKPESPDTGYGYLLTCEDKYIAGISEKGLNVQEFKEKPDSETAQEYYTSGNYYWNSGIYMFRASTILNEISRYYKEIVDNLEKYNFSYVKQTTNYGYYSGLPEISIDYAVMEHSKNMALVPLDCGWNDMGSWENIYSYSEKDEKNNSVSGNVVDIDSENSLIISSSKLVTTIGIRDMAVIETEDAVLVCDISRSQQVKKIYEKLRSTNHQATLYHNTVNKPWGSYTVLQRGEDFLIKTIQVNPGSKLSLQIHRHRSEHWIMLKGIAQATIGDEEFYLSQDDTIDIPVNVKHSLENPGDEELEIMEIQRGDYLDENDIIRLEDKYGRETFKIM